jgi:hypothetical protein
MAAIQRNWNHEPSSRMASGACRWNIHFMAFSGIPGAAQGVEYPGETWPALA